MIEKEPDMTIKTEGGLAEPLPLTDIQRNTFWTRAVVIVLGLILLYIVWLTWYVIKNNVLNNIVAKCVC